MQNQQDYKVFDKIWVIKQMWPQQEFPLAYATYFEKDDARFKKAKETGENWARTSDHYTKEIFEGGAEFIENVPTKGFKIVNSVSRYSTDNKWFEVEDPRGFTLQISAADLIDLISRTNIQNGVIQEKLAWARNGSNWALITEEYFDKAKKKEDGAKGITLAKLQIGDRIESASQGWLTFIGVRYTVTLSCNIENIERHNWCGFGASYQELQEKNPVVEYHHWYWNQKEGIQKYYAFIADDFKTGKHEWSDKNIIMIKNTKIIGYKPADKDFVLPNVDSDIINHPKNKAWGDVAVSFDKKEHAVRFVNSDDLGIVLNTAPKERRYHEPHNYDSKIKMSEHNPMRY